VPVSVDADHGRCSGFAVTEPDGSVIDGGCHTSREDAEAHRDAINAAKASGPMTYRERLLVLAESVSEGDKVEWGDAGEREDRLPRGIVERVNEEEPLDVPDSDFTIDPPAALIRIYRPTGDGHERTDTLVGHQVETLRQTDFAVKEGASDAAEPISLSGPNGRLHIFRAGQHQGANGNTIDYSERDVRAIADSYDPSRHEAPLVVGHPKQNGPAFGWVADLSADSGDLYARPRQVEENFAQAVRDGRYKKISASFYPPGHPNHPIDEASAPYLRHVGFLGAQAPAVKGLDVPSLADTDDIPVITLDLQEMPDDPQNFLQRLFTMMQSYMNGEMEDDAGEGKGKGAGRDTAPDDTAEYDREKDMEENLAEIDTTAAKNAVSEMTSDEMSRADVVQKVADEAGVEPGTVNAILRGDQGASPAAIEAMNTVLGTNLGMEDASEPSGAPEASPEDGGSGLEKDLKSDLEELSETVDTLKDQLSKERARRKKAEAKASRVDNLSEAEEQVRRREIEDTVADAAENGQIHAKHRPIWEEVLDLAGRAEEEIDTAVIALSEDDTRSLQDAIEYLMQNQGPVIALGEVADPADDDAQPVDFSDADSLSHAAKQEQKRASEEGEDLRFSEAMQRVLDRRDV
jgi:transcriptional regulator with XRE-family HTH domain